MKFEIPFDSEILKTQLELHFNMVWSNTLKTIKKYGIFGILSISFGSFQVFNKTNSGYVLIGLGSLLCFLAIIYLSNYIKQKKKTQQNISEESAKNIALGEPLIWEFNDEYLRYKDYKYDLRINWDFFKGYRLIDNHLFVDQNIEGTAPIILSRDELGEDNFNQVLKLVKDKISIK